MVRAKDGIIFIFLFIAFHQKFHPSVFYNLLCAIVSLVGWLVVVRDAELILIAFLCQCHGGRLLAGWMDEVI